MGTQTVERTSTVETEAAALHRLAAQAKAKGVRVIQNVVTNAHFATSASRPGTLHKVTLYSCDCTGFLRHGRCMHLAAVLEMYASLPPVEPDNGGPDTGPDGGGAALPVPADIVLSVVPALSPLDRANRPAIVAYLDSGKTADDRWELTSALLGEAYFTVCGMTDRALEAWCRSTVGLPSTLLVCPSPMCAGAGHVATHPLDDGHRCPTCRGSGVIPALAVAVALVGEAVRHAA